MSSHAGPAITNLSAEILRCAKKYLLGNVCTFANITGAPRGCWKMMQAKLGHAASPETPLTVADEQLTAAEAVIVEEAIAPRMAISMTASTLAIAWYDPAASELKCMEGTEDCSLMDSSANTLLHLALSHARPCIVYVSSKAPDPLLAALKQPMPPVSSQPLRTSHDHQCASPFDVRIERAKLFCPTAARENLACIHLPGMPAGLQPRDRLHIINTMINLASQQQVCAAGALLAVLVRDGVLTPDPDIDGAIPLGSLGEASLNGHMLVDPVSMEALGVFADEPHPSIMGIGRSKEGLSLFGMMDRCVSPPGRRLLRMWFSRPLRDLEALSARQGAVELLMRAGSEATSALLPVLRAVKDPVGLLTRLQSTQTLPDVKHFLQLQQSLRALLRLRQALHGTFMTDGSLPSSAPLSSVDVLHNTGGNTMRYARRQVQSDDEWQRHQPSHEIDGTFSTLSAPTSHGRGQSDPNEPPSGGFESALLQRLAAAISDDLIAAHQMLAGVIDAEQSPEGMCIAYGVSQELDEMKQLYYGLPDLLRQAEAAEVRQLPQTLQAKAMDAWNMVYVPQIGFLLQVEGGLLTEDVLECLVGAQLALEGGLWEDGRAGACYHTNITRELTSKYGDILPKLRDLETAILGRVAQRIVRCGHIIRAATAAAAEVDCLLSLAVAARDFRLTRPRVSDSDALHIVSGRHLLAEAVLGSLKGGFIPNDTNMGLGAPKIHVITGPNLSGKTCYAKQVALIVYLAHIGSFVPAEYAEIGLTDRIFTRVATVECTAIPQSTFMIDLSQCASMLRLATPRSLLIIDEFGKGTLPSDGVALVCGTIAHLADTPSPPRTILSTHFSEVMDERYLPSSPHVSFFTMAVAIDGQVSERSLGDGAAKAETVASDVEFLYRLMPGHAAPAFGLYCSRIAGIDELVLQRAADVLRRRSEGRAVGRAGFKQLVTADGAVQALAARLLKADLDSGETAVKEAMDMVAGAAGITSQEDA